jgi:hypothetical protein
VRSPARNVSIFYPIGSYATAALSEQHNDKKKMYPQERERLLLQLVDLDAAIR